MPNLEKPSVRPGVQHARVFHPSEVADSLAARVAGVGGQPQFPVGWTAYAQWAEDPADVITSTTATWMVPPMPKNRDGQLIYLFNGLERYVPRKDPAVRYILQPVLTWGVSADDGGPYRSIASWYYDHKKRGFKSPSVKVQEGETLTGVIKLTAQLDGNRFNYSCEFAGIADTTLRVVGIGQLVMPVVTLECNDIKSLDDYPETLKTTMRAITVTTAAGPIELKLKQSCDTDTGQCARVTNEAGQVDLFYRRPPVAER